MALRVPVLAALAIGATTAFGCSSVDTQTNPSLVKCQVGLALAQATMTSAGGVGSITVAAQPECQWTAVSEAAWITGVTPPSGQGDGEVRFQVATNPSATAREGSVVFNDIRARLTQSGSPCSVVLSATSQTMAAGAASGTIGVTAPTGCPWTAASNQPWLVVTSGSAGSGAGSVGFSIGANAGGARTGTIAIGGQEFVVTQTEVGVTPCEYSLQASAASIGPTAITVPVSVQAGAGCAWTSTSNVSWLTFVGPSVGLGNGSVTLSATVNTGNSRVGTATIAGRTFTVSQAGSCAISINPAAQAVAAAGGNAAPVSVTAAVGCGWASVASQTWITITSGASGSGNGSVAFSVAANSGPSRVGTISTGGQVHTVTQASGCLVGISPLAQTVVAGGGAAAPVAVTAATGCGWTSVASDSWITITAGGSGSGNGAVNFTVSANSGAARTGSVTIGGQVHTVTQNTGCSFSINPTSLSVGPGNSNNRTVTVTATAGCSWTAVSNAQWLTIDQGASGIGNGTVRFDIAQNNTGDPRVGTITIAGITFTVNQND